MTTLLMSWQQRRVERGSLSLASGLDVSKTRMSGNVPTSLRAMTQLRQVKGNDSEERRFPCRASCRRHDVAVTVVPGVACWSQWVGFRVVSIHHRQQLFGEHFDVSAT